MLPLRRWVGVASVLVLLVAGLAGAAAPAAASGRTPRADAPFTPPREWRAMCQVQRPAGTRLVAGTNCRWLHLDGVYRRYVVVVPQAVVDRPNAGWPLVFMLHGHDGSGEQIMERTDWVRLGRRAGVITVFPTSWRYRFLGDTTGTRWNTYSMDSVLDPSVRLDGYPEDAPYPARDTVLLRRIVKDVGRWVRVDPARIHASGSSNGGNFIGRVAVELGDLVASVSCSGFCAAPPESAWGDITRPVPTLYGLGTDDPNVLHLLADSHDPDPDRIPLRWEASRPLVGDLVADLVRMWRLTDDPTRVVEHTTTTLVMWRTVKPKGTQGAQVRLLLLLHGRHMYPTRRNNPEGFSLAALSWRFFKAHPMG